MKIVVDRNVVEFTPDTPQETADMEILWRVVVDCVNESKRMSPILPMKELRKPRLHLKKLSNS